MYLATLGGYFSPCYPRAHPDPSPVACFLVIPFSSPPKFCLHICSETSPPTADESIQHYRNYPTAASPRMSEQNLQPLSPNAGVDHEADSNGSARG